MKATVFHKHGGLEVLSYEDMPDPIPSATEVLVKVNACSINHLDIWIRNGMPGVGPFPHILGADIAGEVAGFGVAVKGLTQGQKVLLAPATSCGKCQACLSGEDNACASYNIHGNRSQGGYAEYIVVPDVNVLPFPQNLSTEEAASVPLVFLTAWHMLITRAVLKPGEEVLVLGAGSGVGIAAIQIAKLWGARVIATAGSAEKLEKARALGADEVIDHSKQDIVGEVKKLTVKRGVDIVFEHVGPATWEKSILSMARKGRLVTCGATTGPKVEFDLRYVFSRHLSILGSYMGTKGELIEALKYIAMGKLKPVVDKVFPLKEAAAGQKRIEDRVQFGKVVLVP